MAGINEKGDLCLNIKQLAKVMDCTAKFAYNLSQPEFVDRLTRHNVSESMANHIWNKFVVEHDRNFTNMFANLDSNNQEAVMMAIVDYCFL